MSRFLLITLALAAGFASSELVAEGPRELGSYDDDYDGGKGKGGMMMGGMMSGKGYYDDDEPEEPHYPEPEPCVCVEVCDDDDYGKGKGGMMMGGMMSGKGYDDDYEPSCREVCTGVCFPAELECCEYASVCESTGKGMMMSGMMSGMSGMSGGKGDYRELSSMSGMMSGKGYEEECEDVCVKYCEPTFIFNPGDGELCFDTGSYTTPSGCGCDCECCLDEPECDDDDCGKGKGGMMSGGMMSGGMMSGGMMSGKGKGKGGRQLMMGKGGMMSGKGYEEDPSFTCSCGCACEEPEKPPSGKGGMMSGGMMSGMSGMSGMMSGGKGSTDDDSYRL